MFATDRGLRDEDLLKLLHFLACLRPLLLYVCGGFMRMVPHVKLEFRPSGWLHNLDLRCRKMFFHHVSGSFGPFAV
jgi:hypothetical protein